MADYLTTATLQLAQLLTGNAWFEATVKPGNQITKLAGNKWPEKSKRAPADYPQFEIEPTRLLSCTQKARTFGNIHNYGDQVQQQVWEYDLKITWESLDRNNPNRMLTVVIAQLSMNPTLMQSPLAVVGLNSITSSNTEQTIPGSQSGKAGGMRLVQLIRLPVTFELHTVDLRAAIAATP